MAVAPSAHCGAPPRADCCASCDVTGRESHPSNSRPAADRGAARRVPYTGKCSRRRHPEGRGGPPYPLQLYRRAPRRALGRARASAARSRRCPRASSNRRARSRSAQSLAPPCCLLVASVISILTVLIGQSGCSRTHAHVLPSANSEDGGYLPDSRPARGSPLRGAVARPRGDRLDRDRPRPVARRRRALGRELLRLLRRRDAVQPARTASATLSSSSRPHDRAYADAGRTHGVTRGAPTAVRGATTMVATGNFSAPAKRLRAEHRPAHSDRRSPRTVSSPATEEPSIQ